MQVRYQLRQRPVADDDTTAAEIGSLLHRPGRLMLVACVIGIVTGIWGTSGRRIRLHVPVLVRT
jgi:hypothetical protein